MKHTIRYLVLIVCAMLLYPTTSAQAEETLVGSIKYSLSSDGSYAIVSGYRNYYKESILEPFIPSTAQINGKSYPVKEIKDSAFYNCKKLKNITLSDSIITIGKEAFLGCSKLDSITLSQNLIVIGEHAFSGPLKSITFPQSLKTIGDNAFSGCDSLRSVTLFGDTLLTIGHFAFSNCNSLDSVTILGNVIIEYDAFYECDSLKSVTILGDSIATIAGYAFSNCESLKSVKLKNVSTISTYAFGGCFALESITLEGLTTAIGREAFKNCVALNSITLPESVTTLERGTFSGCTNLSKIICKATVPPTAVYNSSSTYNNTFYEVNTSECILYVPKGTVEDYKTAEGWKEFTHIEELSDEPTSINVIGTGEAAEVERYTVDGMRISQPQKGINIVKMSDGTVKKVIVK